MQIKNDNPRAKPTALSRAYPRAHPRAFPGPLTLDEVPLSVPEIGGWTNKLIIK